MNRSLVMIEWARDNEPTHTNRNEFIWHQLLLSLLYDDVWAQDETIISSKRLANWFSDDFNVLEKLLKCGALGLLKRPIERYPTELQEKARVHPVQVRREYVEKFSVDNRGNPATFTPRQLAFQNRLEAFLIENPRTHRFAGESRPHGPNLMENFVDLMRRVLIDPTYGAWLSRRFPRITIADKQEFLRSMDDPPRLIARLRARALRIPSRYDDERFPPVFDTAVAMQLAASFESASAANFRELIETVFGKPYCQEESAEGRYGRRLRALPTEVEIDDEGKLPDVRIVHVETIALRLPKPTADLPDIVQSIRHSQSGQKLRATMQHLGAEPTFGSVTGAWREVAESLASQVASAEMGPVTIRALAGETSRGAVIGVLGSLVAPPIVGHGSPSILEAGLGTLIGSTLDVTGNIFGRRLRYELRRRQHAEVLGSAVQFSCVQHPVVVDG